MAKHLLRRLAMVGGAVSALLVGSVGIAVANPPTATATHTSCVTRTGPWAAKACVHVTATSIGSGQWKVTGVRASLSEIKFNPKGKSYYFDMNAWHSGLNDNSLIGSGAVSHSSGKSVSHTFNLADDVPQPNFWKKFTGTVFVDVTVDNGGWSRLEFGTPQQRLN